MTPQRSAMRFARLGALLALTAVPSPAVVADEPSVDAPPWRADYAAALEEARSSGRLLWIQFTGSWCPNCVRMERDSFHHPEVLKHTRSDLVAVKLAADVEEELTAAFELTGLPASVVVDPSRNVVALHQGYLGPEELSTFLNQALASRGPASPPRRDAEEPLSGDRRDVALEGYCPVSLVVERRLIPGRREYEATHEGRLYRFADEPTLRLFQEDPERYTPLNDGACPVTQIDQGRTVDGDPHFGALYDGRLYLCADAEARDRFFDAPDRYLIDGRDAHGEPRGAFVTLAPAPSLRR